MKSLRNILLVGLGCLALAACDDKPAPAPSYQVFGPSAENQHRFTVQYVGDFADDSAYGHRRNMFVVNDSKTGKEFFGISGVGIAEVGTHMEGKVQRQDER